MVTMSAPRSNTRRTRATIAGQRLAPRGSGWSRRAVALAADGRRRRCRARRRARCGGARRRPRPIPTPASRAGARQPASPASRRAAGRRSRSVTPLARRVVGDAACDLRRSALGGRPNRSRKVSLKRRTLPKPDGQRHFGHRQARLVQQLLGEQHAPRLGDGDRRGAEMVLEQPAQLAAADAQPLGQHLDTGVARRRARRRRSAPARGSPCSRCRARRRGRARSRAGSAGRGGSPPPAPRRPRRRSGSSRTSACAPGRSAGSRSRSR